MSPSACTRPRPTRRSVLISAAIGSAAAMAAPFVRHSYAAGTLSLGAVDHWVPDSFTTMPREASASRPASQVPASVTEARPNRARRAPRKLAKAPVPRMRMRGGRGVVWLTDATTVARGSVVLPSRPMRGCGQSRGKAAHGLWKSCGAGVGKAGVWTACGEQGGARGFPVRKRRPSCGIPVDDRRCLR